MQKKVRHEMETWDNRSLKVLSRKMETEMDPTPIDPKPGIILGVFRYCFKPCNVWMAP